MERNLARAHGFSDLKLALVDAICALSEHEQHLEARPDKTSKDRDDISAFFLLRFRLNDAILTVHAVEAGWKGDDARSDERLEAALDEARGIGPLIRQRKTAKVGTLRMIDLVDGLQAVAATSPGHEAPR